MPRLTIEHRLFRCGPGHQVRCSVESEGSAVTYRAFAVIEHDIFLKQVRRRVDAPRLPLPVCPECGNALDQIDGETPTNAQVAEQEAAAVAVHPKTGDVSFCFPTPDSPMPALYASQGYVRVKFKSFHALQAFCRARGLVNDVETDFSLKDADAFERSMKDRRKVWDEKVTKALRQTKANRQLLRSRGFKFPKEA